MFVLLTVIISHAYNNVESHEIIQMKPEHLQETAIVVGTAFRDNAIYHHYDTDITPENAGMGGSTPKT